MAPTSAARASWATWGWKVEVRLLLQREEPAVDRRTFPARLTTFGALSIDGAPDCLTLEDAVLEDALEEVANWKVPGRTAIPAGIYDLVLEDSPRFGPDTLTIVGVTGFTLIRIHSGKDIDSTEGCMVVGDRIDRPTFSISGGIARGVLARLKAKVKAAIRERGERVQIEVRNAEVT